MESFIVPFNNIRTKEFKNLEYSFLSHELNDGITTVNSQILAANVSRIIRSQKQSRLSHMASLKHHALENPRGGAIFLHHPYRFLVTAIYRRRHRVRCNAVDSNPASSACYNCDFAIQSAE